MATHKESNEWMSVPAFGDWDMKNGVPDYSVDFTKIREMRKQNKRDFSRGSLGNDEELLAATSDAVAKAVDDVSDLDDDHRRRLNSDHHHSSLSGRKKIISYFQCCIRA